MRRSYKLLSLLVAGACIAPATGMSGVTAQRIGHAPLQGQTPSPNSNLTMAPSSVALLAGEGGLGHSGDFINVVDAKGGVHSGAVVISDRENSTLLSTAVTNMAKGWYAVHWNVLSDDGHPMGGENGSWWAFGVKATSKKAPAKKITVRNAVQVTGVPASFVFSMNGVKVGARTLTSTVKWGTVSTMKWSLTRSSIPSLVGAEFSWGATCAKKSHTCTAKGVLPFAGTYQLDVQVQTKSAQGSMTSVWSTTVNVVI